MEEPEEYSSPSDRVSQLFGSCHRAGGMLMVMPWIGIGWSCHVLDVRWRYQDLINYQMAIFRSLTNVVLLMSSRKFRQYLSTTPSIIKLIPIIRC